MAVSEAFRNMAAIFSIHISNGNCDILMQISLKFVPDGSVDNKRTMVYIMAWHQIGNKPLSKSVMTWFTNAYASLVLDKLTNFPPRWSWLRTYITSKSMFLNEKVRISAEIVYNIILPSLIMNQHWFVSYLLRCDPFHRYRCSLLSSNELKL